MSIAAEKLYYTLAGFLLLTALFVLHPSQRPEFATLQNQMISQFLVAGQQTLGDQPYFEDLALIFDAVHEFYDQAGIASIALFEHGAADRDLAVIFRQTYRTLAGSFSKSSNPTVTFMSEPPIYNIIPASTLSGIVSGAIEPAVNDQTPWVTIKDNFTGQLYCLAMYNGNVNKYLGPCKKDEYH